MSNQEIMMTCKRCGSKQLVGKMSYDKDGATLICASCSSKQFNKPMASSSSSSIPKEKTMKKIKYICTFCNYKFSRDPSKHNIDICPYCSKQGNIEEYDEQGAEKLLREVSEMD